MIVRLETSTMRVSNIDRCANCDELFKENDLTYKKEYSTRLIHYNCVE